MTTTTAATKEKKQRNYFVTDVNRYYLDDGESFIEHKPLDEGLFQQFQDLSSKIKLDRTGENTELDIRPGMQRSFLVENLVTNWNMLDENDKPVSFSPNRIKALPPEIVGGLVDDIYKHNPILGRTEDEEESEGKRKTK